MEDEPDGFCIYATGSYGRLEASELSDIDVFMVDTSNDRPNLPTLSLLEQKIVVGRTIEAVRQSGLPDLDRDGEFVQFLSRAELIGNLGLPDDEIQNTLTARLLLLLESVPLFGAGGHARVLDSVLSVYWRDFEAFSKKFRPTFLLNDILKYWRLLCVDYEAKMTEFHDGLEGRKKRRNVKNLKLRYNRIMTCFSAVAALCDCYSHRGTATLGDAISICSSTPIQRLKKLHLCQHGSERARVDKILRLYNSFLQMSAVGKEEMVEHLSREETILEERARADEFGNAFYELVTASCGRSDLLRYLVI